MTLSMRVFGKDLEALTYQDLEEFFTTDKHESDSLEFKSINAAGALDQKIQGLSKSVCAFLNSDGGILIWGAPSGVSDGGNGPKRFVGALTPYPTHIEKDALINMVTDRIVPIPNRIKLQICNQEQNFVFVFEISPSNYAPHQTDNTYYMRIDGQTRIAPHHYIEALFKKVRFPDICIYFKITGANVLANGHYQVHFDLYIINWSQFQNDEEISFRVFGGELVFPLAQIAPHSNNYRWNGKEYFKDPVQKILHFGQPIRDGNYFTVSPTSLGANQHMEIHIIVSGRYSPTKKSDYTIDFSKMPNRNEMIVVRSENVTIAEWQAQNGVNRDTVLKELLQ
ncbi:AlbA family DNA-binding domain-containing protein [Dawidia soli]|uniref:DNA binding domain-containing protein n=1 Tax=Dawidia soli TaxID=2782352 RepID=A0AAP2GEZ4_9BACT|nr:ATP-binding protein [Dawidia soli]MBT1688864.1 putative DNA binding domain-containing protein [Dawidia soli]